MLVLALIAMGIYSLKNLPIDALPDITNNQVQIITTSQNLATQEVELFITYPIEMAMKTIPDMVELRSVSRFGLSIVTIVFEEHVDIYWARSQINERLKEAEESIPDGFGEPFLAPISTGLGEIYQYTVTAAKGFEDVYNSSELRSIQDWLIVPQLLGTKGVAEVNTLGGHLKEYEVAVDPDRMKSMGITMAEIFTALSQNNENTGGAYIDKKPYVYFIRSIGMASSLEDISKIVIKNNKDIPVLIRDIAEVKFGKAVRYGATTRNGTGEVVNGMVMMLKGENSAEIVGLVKEKLEQIKITLPEGINIVPYLDRSKLVNRAISTVRTNLIEGALIVLFILVLLIGNWRAGLIVASVIPLALLFAVSMMRFFGVSGNLMSLGAIDFGLIVDGAVIIVEAIVHRLQTKRSENKLTVLEMDEEVYSATSSIRSSAAFGEIIILIVYLPILALVGIEGKMFTPMALTVSFAILGAFILSLTYVPMMSALCLSKTTGHKENFSDKIIAFFQMLYTPILNLALKVKWLVLILAFAMFGLALYIFSTLGGEFIPNLSEGDIATHVMIPPGSSLEQEIEATTKAEQLLMKHFPEIEQVVSKIGSAEIPTDPMPMEVADVMIILKDKKEWTSASSKEEMFEKMEKVLDDLPGVTTEFSQPIQMRFNELMTGIRSDVGIKVFGDDIERLVAIGDEVQAIVESVTGVQDARAEAVSGLPQITVKYNKDKLALYGLNVGELNDAVSMGFAGSKAGVIYEEEKRFDLVVRLAEPFRSDIDNLRNLYVPLPSGNQIPLEQVADIDYVRGPAQISRENGKRRIIVGFNVRNRDVESVVKEIQTKFDDQIKLPVGYYVEYAGQFENLERAKARLSIALPIALALIFILLYFTFNSVKQSLLIFTAIPLSAIGGVFALWLRSMPFSISAGIGFIALFGVAVLNGIVLIAYFNQLKKEGMTNIIERIKVGTKVRLRPVIMTGAVASLGFLPMALSNSAGAEVQKPLATVVIGGLLTATLLTLIVLPILYYYSEKFEKQNIIANKAITMIVFFFLCIGLNAQNIKTIGLEEAIGKALQTNKSIELINLNLEKYEQIKNGSYIMPKAEISASYGQINSNQFDQSYSISQSFNPFIAKLKKAYGKELIKKGNHEIDLAKQELVYQLRDLFDENNYQQARLKLIEKQKELFEQISTMADKKFEYGEIGIIEKSTTDLQVQTLIMELKQINSILALGEIKLESIIYEKARPEISSYEAINWNLTKDSTLLDNHPLLGAAMQEVNLIKSEAEMLKGERKPDLAVGYFIQSFNGEFVIDEQIKNYNAFPRFQGINIGLNIPIFRKGYNTQIKSIETNALIEQTKMEQLKFQIQNEFKYFLQQYEFQKENINYYKTIALPNAELVESKAKKSYDMGETGFKDYLRAVNSNYEIKKSALAAIHDFNDTIFSLMYLLNE